MCNYILIINLFSLALLQLKNFHFLLLLLLFTFTFIYTYIFKIKQFQNLKQICLITHVKLIIILLIYVVVYIIELWNNFSIM